MTVSGSEFAVSVDGVVVESGTMILNESAVPRQYDATITGEFPNKGLTYHAIYEFRDGGLVACVNFVPGKERPTRFAAEPGNTWQVAVWRHR